MSRIQFPDVPNLPGIPPLPRRVATQPVARVVLGTIQGLLWRLFQSDSRWGIYDATGAPLADSSLFEGLGIGSTLSTSAVDYTKSTKVSDFPVERGSFAAYNKVEEAATPTVTLTMGGGESDRTAFLEAIDKACKSTALYSVVTPEVTYIDYSIERYNYRRESFRGATLLRVDVSLKEIRQVSAQYAKSNGQAKAPKDAGAAPQIDGGKVQAPAPTKSMLKTIADKLGI
jgi:hypothetical protein